jgi:hypothetical protein
MGSCYSKSNKEPKPHIKNKLQIHGRTIGTGERALYQKIIRRNHNMKSLIDKTVYGLTSRSLVESDISSVSDFKSTYQFTNETCMVLDTLSDVGEEEKIKIKQIRFPSQAPIRELKAQPFELELRNFLIDEEAYKQGDLSACRVLSNILK